MTDKEKLTKLKLIIKYEGICEGISCLECPLQKCVIKNFSNEINYWDLDFKNEAQKLLKNLKRKIKLERILKK
jgi:hypothetical protein